MKKKKAIIFLLFGVPVSCALLAHDEPAPISVERVSYSQYGQDTYVNEQFFKNKRQGIFVDIGASDGIFLSNTYFFEKQLDWSGICVEPRPDKFVDLQKNRNCLCVYGCIAERKGEQTFRFLKGHTGDLSGLVNCYDPHHVQRINNELTWYGGSSEHIMVPCYCLTDILQEYGIRHVDYLSIDTEGGELSILKSINFKEIMIDVIDVENNYGEPIADFLNNQGYMLVAHIGCDEIYQRNDYLQG